MSRARSRRDAEGRTPGGPTLFGFSASDRGEKADLSLFRSFRNRARTAVSRSSSSYLPALVTVDTRLARGAVTRGANAVVVGKAVREAAIFCDAKNNPMDVDSGVHLEPRRDSDIPEIDVLPKKTPACAGTYTDFRAPRRNKFALPPQPSVTRRAPGARRVASRPPCRGTTAITATHISRTTRTPFASSTTPGSSTRCANDPRVARDLPVRPRPSPRTPDDPAPLLLPRPQANVRNYYLQFEEQLAQRAAASAPAVGGAAAAYHAQVNQVLQRNLGGVPAIGTMAYHLPPAGYPGALPPGVPAGMAYRQPPPGPPGGYAAPKPF